VLVEKPIADTLEDAQRIVALATEAGVQLLVGHHRRYNPLVQQARSIVRGGLLGKLVGVSVLWTLRKPDDYFEVTWRRSRPGGGPALINLIHDLDNLRFICGEIRQVQALASSAVRGFEVEDTLSLTIAFENGALGSMLVSDAVVAPWSYELNTGENPFYPQVEENCYHFVGTLGALAFPRMERWRYADEAKAGWQYPLLKSRPDIAYADPLQGQLEHFCRVIEGEEVPVVDGQDGTRSLAAVLAVLASAESQRPVIL
jgi:predicted dehydrogenase